MTRPKYLQDIQGLQNLRTLRGEHFGSIPKVRRAHFLDLYVQEKERERLEQELHLLDKKTHLVKQKLEKTLENIYKIRNTVNAQEQDNEHPNHTQEIPPLYVVKSPVNKTKEQRKYKNNNKKRKAA